MRRPVAIVLFVVVTVAIAVVGLWPSHVDQAIAPQLRAVLLEFSHHRLTEWITYPVVESAANIALFVPFGIFGARLLGPRWGWLSAVIGIVGSSVIEYAQGALLPGRTSDPRDVLANSAGAVLGAVIGMLTMRVAGGADGDGAHRRSGPDQGATPSERSSDTRAFAR